MYTLNLISFNGLTLHLTVPTNNMCKLFNVLFIKFFLFLLIKKLKNCVFISVHKQINNSNTITVLICGTLELSLSVNLSAMQLPNQH